MIVLWWMIITFCRAKRTELSTSICKLYRLCISDNRKQWSHIRLAMKKPTPADHLIKYIRHEPKKNVLKTRNTSQYQDNNEVTEIKSKIYHFCVFFCWLILGFLKEGLAIHDALYYDGKKTCFERAWLGFVIGWNEITPLTTQITLLSTE